MLRKILSSLNPIGHNWSYFVVCGIVAISIILTNAKASKSKTPQLIIHELDLLQYSFHDVLC